MREAYEQENETAFPLFRIARDLRGFTKTDLTVQDSTACADMRGKIVANMKRGIA